MYVSDKVDFKPKLFRTGKEDHFILIKGTIHQEEITIVNLNVPNVCAPNFIKHTLLALKKHKYTPNTMVVGNFSTPLSQIDRSSRQKKSTKYL
jgi:hypothetical protein